MFSFCYENYIQILFMFTVGVWITSGAECPQPSSDRTEAELGGTIKLELHNWKEDEVQNLILYHIQESTGETVTVLTANDDGVPRPYNGYTNRVALDMPPFGIVSVLISDAKRTDSGTYVVVLLSYMYTRHKSCYEVYILGEPTTPIITQIVGGPHAGANTFIKVNCSSTSTTVPKTHQWKLRYFFRVNGDEVSPVADDQSRFMVRENMLMIADITSALSITCTVQEENSRPRNVSSTIVVPSYTCHSCHQAQLGKNTGLTLQFPLFGWLMAVSLLIS